jgi:hypothetical protein
MHLLLAVVLSLAGPDAGAPTDGGWKGYEGTYIDVYIPPDWSFTTVGDDGFRPPPSARSTVVIQFLHKADKKPGYTSFDRWLAERGVKKGKSIKVGPFKAVTAPPATEGDKVVTRTYIAVPYARKKGGEARAFQLVADRNDPALPAWTAVYQRMLKTLILHEKNASSP